MKLHFDYKTKPTVTATTGDDARTKNDASMRKQLPSSSNSTTSLFCCIVHIQNKRYGEWCI